MCVYSIKTIQAMADINFDMYIASIERYINMWGVIKDIQLEGTADVIRKYE